VLAGLSGAGIDFVATQNDSGKTTGSGEPFRHPVRLAHEAVADQARRRPGATAVVAGDARLTYGELDQSANRLARYLTSLGAGPETLVGVCLERGAEAIRGLLAIMKAGSGYLPLDPSLPRPGWPVPARRAARWPS
jgi:non-ribosomal peptide synthetase component F